MRIGGCTRVPVDGLRAWVMRQLETEQERLSRALLGPEAHSAWRVPRRARAKPPPRPRDWQCASGTEAAGNGRHILELCDETGGR